MIEIMKFICLFLGIMFTIVNVVRVRARLDIPGINFILHSLGIAGFIYLQWLI